MVNTMTDFRALCAELHAAIQIYIGLDHAAANMSSREKASQLLDVMAKVVDALSQIKPDCVACEDNPAPGNSHCRVCGLEAQ